MHYNPHFLELLTILERRNWQYEIQQDVFYIMVGNMEFEFSKHDKSKTLELIDLITTW